MARRFAAVTVALGVLVAAIGVMFQIAGAAAVVYCSVAGTGIALIVLGGALWLFQATRQTPTSEPA